MNRLTSLILVYGDTSDLEEIQRLHPTTKTFLITETTRLEEIREVVSRRSHVQIPVAVASKHGIPPDRARVIQQAIEEGDLLCAIYYETIHQRGEAWMHSALSLLNRIQRDRVVPLQELRQSTDRRGLIVGSGPSVVALHDYHRQPDAILAVCDTAVAGVRDAGIIPDFVVSCESIPAARATIPRAHGTEIAVVTPEVGADGWELLQDLGYPVILAHTDVPPFRRCYGRLGLRPLPSGGSVATVCHTVLDLVGCTEIWAVGIDSATPDGLMYPGRQSAATPQPPVEAYGGHGTVGTTQQLTAYRQWLAAAALKSSKPHYNCSVGGARIPYWIERPIADLPVADTPVVGLRDRLGYVDPIDRDAAHEVRLAEISQAYRLAAANRVALTCARQLCTALQQIQAIESEPGAMCVGREAALPSLNDLVEIPLPPQFEILQRALTRSVEVYDGLTRDPA